MNSIKEEAFYYRDLYRVNAIDREEAKKHIIPYIIQINNKSKQIAKKHNQKPKYISFATFVR